jgi:hypothetical protein
LTLTYLAKFIAKRVFRDYKTMDELLGLEPAGDEMFQLHWDPEVLDLPSSKKMMERSTRQTYSVNV